MESSELRAFINFLKTAGEIKTQADLAEKIGIARAHLSVVLNRDRHVSHEIAHKVRTSYGQMYEKFQKAIKEPERDPETEREKILVNGTTYEELSDGSYLATVDLIPFEAHARYLADDTQEHVDDWTKIQFIVDKVGRGNYKGFKTKNDSMFNEENPSFFDTPDGALLYCRELGRQHWQDGFNPKKAPFGWVILTKQNIILKDIIDFDKTTGEITCHSRNTSPEYQDFKLNLNDVYQIFKVIKRTM